MPERNNEIPEQAAQPMSTDLARECEIVVRRVWGGVFGAEAHAETGNFFQLGGDSAMAVTLIQRLADHFDVTLHVVNVFQYPTVRELAGFLGQRLSEQAGVSVRGEETEEILV